jgi:hypothetical protein
MLRIGIDFDGTIADTNALKSEWITANLGKRIPSYLCDRTSAVPLIGQEDYDRMRRHVYSAEEADRLMPIDGVMTAMGEMTVYSELFLVTARRKLDIVRHWLEKWGLLQYIQVTDPPANHLTKLGLCSQLGITLLIDDDARHLAVLPGYGSVYAILFKPGAPISYDARGLSICRSWSAVVEIASALNQPPSDAGVVTKN